jgi:hypothetical protein
MSGFVLIFVLDSFFWFDKSKFSEKVYCFCVHEGN